ncbi:MAG: hypothetical protein KC561_04065, partial [Myxococcales bacterium]|nr:hypothetical protein [Myxococcales bacterium]
RVLGPSGAQLASSEISGPTSRTLRVTGADSYTVVVDYTVEFFSTTQRVIVAQAIPADSTVYLGATVHTEREAVGTLTYELSTREGADSYRIAIPCGEVFTQHPENSAVYEIDTRRVEHDRLSGLALALSGDSLSAWSSIADIEIAEGQTVLSFPDWTSEGLTRGQVTITGLAPAVSRVNVEARGNYHGVFPYLGGPTDSSPEETVQLSYWYPAIIENLVLEFGIRIPTQARAFIFENGWLQPTDDGLVLSAETFLAMPDSNNFEVSDRVVASWTGTNPNADILQLHSTWSHNGVLVDFILVSPPEQTNRLDITDALHAVEYGFPSAHSSPAISYFDSSASDSYLEFLNTYGPIRDGRFRPEEIPYGGFIVGATSYDP